MINMEHEFDELFDQYDRNVDRFSSMLNTIFVIGGVFVAVVIFLLTPKNNIDINYNDTTTKFFTETNMELCFCFLFLAFIITMLNIVEGGEYNRLNKLKISNDIVEYRDADELNEIHLNLISIIKKQQRLYDILILSIFLSFFSFFSHFFTIFITYGIVLQIIGIIIIFHFMRRSFKKIKYFKRAWKKYGLHDDFIESYFNIKIRNNILIACLCILSLSIFCYFFLSIEISITSVLLVVFLVLLVLVFYYSRSLKNII